MPHFDMYLEEKEPEMLQYSERLMKLAVCYYDILENPIEETNVFREKEYSRNRGATGRGPNTQESLLQGANTRLNTNLLSQPLLDTAGHSDEINLASPSQSANIRFCETPKS
jgi:hypothetical protein